MKKCIAKSILSEKERAMCMVGTRKISSGSKKSIKEFIERLENDGHRIDDKTNNSFYINDHKVSAHIVADNSDTSWTIGKSYPNDKDLEYVFLIRIDDQESDYDVFVIKGEHFRDVYKKDYSDGTMTRMTFDISELKNKKKGLLMAECEGKLLSDNRLYDWIGENLK